MKIKYFLIFLFLLFVPYLKAQIITTVAGNGDSASINYGGFSGDGGPAIAARLYHPAGLAINSKGEIFFGDYINRRIRKVSTNGIITTVAGTGIIGNNGDGGPAILAEVCGPNGIRFDKYDNLYFADACSGNVRKISTSGIITNIAGGGNSYYDGVPADSMYLDGTDDVAFDSKGNLYLSCSLYPEILKIDSLGIIHRITGNGPGINGFHGDGGPAINAILYGSAGITFDGNDNLFFADYNGLVREINTSGIIYTVVGDTVGAGYNSNAGYSNDGVPALGSKLNMPFGVVFDPAGNMFIADTWNSRIRKVSNSGIITTIAGTGVNGYNGDGILAINAQLYEPHSLAFDSIGNLYFTDGWNDRVRMITNVGQTLKVSSTTICSGQTATLTATGASTYSWSPSTYLNTTTGNTVISNSPHSITYTVTGTKSNGINVVTTFLTVNQLPTLTINSPTICIGDTANLLAGGAVTYSWSPSSSLLGTAGSSVKAHPIISSNYSLSATDIKGCVNDTVAFIQVNSLPIINIGKDTSLCKPSCILTANAGNYSYVWNTGTLTQQVNVVKSGTYWVAITDSNSCKNSDTINVTFYSPPKINILKDSNECGNSFNPILINATYSNTVLYSWNDGFIGVSHLLTTPGSYWVEYTLNNTCVSRDSFNLNLYPYPIVDLGNDTSFCQASKTLSATNVSASYSWSTGQTSSAIEVTAPGTYWVVVNGNGCITKDTLTIFPLLSNLNFELPNIVTPNNDGINDFIDFSKYEFSSLQLEIYNRWGIKVFESTNPTCIWKPTEDDGTYYYTAHYSINCGVDTQNKTLKGFIMLTR